MTDTVDDRLAELSAENTKLVRWHREGRKALEEMRGTIQRLRTQLAVLPAPVDRSACDCEAEVHMGVGIYHHPWCATKWPAAVAEAEARRLALSQALGLGTGAPWDAIQERAEELHLAPVDRAAVLRELEARYRRYAQDSVHPVFSAAYAAVANDMSRMADEAQQPEEAGHSCDNCEGIDPSTCLANPHQQQPEEAWPSESQWRVEIYDPGANQWMPAGSLTTKAEAERRLALAAERAPRWADDGTNVRRRIVRTTVTYTVEPEGPR
ncbi:hypothetical protein [Streptomyces sp. NPDC002221]|uniref:hypothetical protein n=1 Tax=Streptomyces sp. NPDC002221 TaxID=3364639 RepID=UPI0036A64765